MGLDCSHDAWHGAYSAFMRWRTEIARIAGFPPLELMEGFYDPKEYGSLYFGQQMNRGDVYESKRARLEERLPISWDCLKPSPLHELLYHSDCDGEIQADHCTAIADALESLIPSFPSGDAAGHIGNWRDKTAQFVKGLRAAAGSREPLIFS